ncbi:hypothetical protein J1N51_10755 [Psychrosphaera ytuae]|uniref:Uncharacterized protein n=1 Tax=Psychrosphaera ytuae TaxID=2820710 RepID=A0A975D9R8_9GAMM|nr:hypothetical protein [Psychrosphaera ytuae]QTH63215.1 hypothetical protein J1N51_10755 [Psychrosphaera ytuae]
MKQTQTELDRLVETLPKEMEPKRDLWQGIEQAIAHVPQEQPKSTKVKNSFEVHWGAVAAAIAPIAILAGVLMNNQPAVQQGPEWLAPVSASFEIQKRNMLRQVSGHQSVNEHWRTTLAELEEAESALKEALIHQPQDPALMKMLNQVYQQQLDVIAKSHQSKFKQI